LHSKTAIADLIVTADQSSIDHSCLRKQCAWCGRVT
jgi:hypothetical protein